MKVRVIYASRYGATRDVAEAVSEGLRKRGLEAEVSDVSRAVLGGADVYLLGSGVYANRLLPEMEKFISDNSFEGLRVGLFATAMRTEPVERRGRLSGGVLIFDRYGLVPFIKRVLGGRMDFGLLSEDDRGGLERFYTAIGLTEEQKVERRKLRDIISKPECDEFVMAIIKAITIDE